MAQLSSISLFAECDPAHLARFEQRCAWRTFGENALIVDYDDTSTDVFFIASGNVRVLYRAPSGREVILGEVAEGGIFGELAALDGVGRSANVTALCKTEVGVMHGTVFQDMVAGEPGLAGTIMKVLCERIRATNIRLAEYSCLNTKHRLYSELMRLSRPRKGFELQRIVTPPPTQQDLANRIGCRREVVSREVANLKREAMVETNKGGLVLLDPSELNRRISAALNDESGEG